MFQDLSPDHGPNRRAPDARSFDPPARKPNGNERNHGGQAGLRTELARFWPQIVFALAVAFGVGAFQAIASQTDQSHEARIKLLEVSTPHVQRELGAMKAQADATSRAVDRIEVKIDRLLEQGR